VAAFGGTRSIGLGDTKAGVTDEERAELIANLESIVAKGSASGSPEHFNSHEAKEAAERLIPYNRRLGAFDDIKRLRKTTAEAFEHFAGMAEPMLAAALLQTAADEYRDAGMTDERDRTRILMQQQISAAGNNLKTVEHEIAIAKDDMDRFLGLVVADDLGTSFLRIARSSC